MQGRLAFRFALLSAVRRFLQPQPEQAVNCRELGVATGHLPAQHGHGLVGGRGHRHGHLARQRGHQLAHHRRLAHARIPGQGGHCAIAVAPGEGLELFQDFGLVVCEFHVLVSYVALRRMGDYG
jgi:hypothetical protein